MNPYTVLGVERTADNDAIRKAYRKLAKKYHPDVNKDPKAEAKFKEINAAYEAIGEPEKRALYDEFGEQALRTGFDAAEARRWKQAQESRAARGGAGGVDFGEGVDMEDLLGSLFGAGLGGFDRAGARPRRGVDQQVELGIDFMTTVLGAEQEMSLRHGDGAVETLKIRIPAGAKDGGRLKLKGHGLPPRGGGPAGDLNVILKVAPHPLLRRVDDDLEMDVPVTVEEAMFGSQITVPTPTGDVKVTVPPGLTSSSRLRLKGKGIQRKPPGDLFLVLRPTLPPDGGPEVREAAAVLSKAYPADVRADLKL
jgi:DnaJ-class molecular chaperone